MHPFIEIRIENPYNYLVYLTRILADPFAEERKARILLQNIKVMW